MSTDESNIPSVKIVLLGNTGVGKSSLVNSWTTGAWDDSIQTTVGASHQRKRIKLYDKDVDLILWDTAGQEVYRALTPLYTRSASFAILTASIIDKESFVSLDDWIELLKSTCEHMPKVCLCINKMDLVEQSNIGMDKIQEEYNDKYPALFFVSAHSGDGVEELFMHAANEGYKFSKKINGDEQNNSINLNEITASKDNSCC